MQFPDGTQALSDVSFSVARGEFVAVVGPSGCGKSTLLRIASGLEKPTRGHIAVAGSRIGYVFQQAALLPWRDLEGNVALLTELEGFASGERKRLAREAIKLVGLEGFERHHPHQLSGGMQMRASLARSLTLSPEVFLLDEPFGAVDEMTRERLNEELLRLFTLRRFGALLITHSVSEAVYLAARVIVLSERPGRIVAEIPVSLPYPRSAEIRFEPEFSRVSREISRVLRQAGAEAR